MYQRTLKYLQAILDEGSFSLAAKKLYISQPSLSLYIKKIEDEIGAELFDRKSHPIKLTYAGEVYLHTEEQIAALKKNRLQLLDDISSLNRGRIIIGSSYFRSSFLLSFILPEFKKRYPGIDLKLEEGTTEELEEMAYNGMVDFSILLLPFQHTDLEYEELFDEKIVLALSPRHPLAQDYPENIKDGRYPFLSFAQLKNEPFIVMKPGQHIRSSFFSLCSQLNMPPNIILETANMPTAQILSAAGIGATIIPDTLAKFNKLEPKPAYFYLKECTQLRHVVVAHSKSQKLSKAARAFIDILHEFSDLFTYTRL